MDRIQLATQAQKIGLYIASILNVIIPALKKETESDSQIQTELTALANGFKQIQGLQLEIGSLLADKSKRQKSRAKALQKETSKILKVFMPLATNLKSVQKSLSTLPITSKLIAIFNYLNLVLNAQRNSEILALDEPPLLAPTKTDTSSSSSCYEGSSDASDFWFWMWYWYISGSDQALADLTIFTLKAGLELEHIIWNDYAKAATFTAKELKNIGTNLAKNFPTAAKWTNNTCSQLASAFDQTGRERINALGLITQSDGTSFRFINDHAEHLVFPTSNLSYNTFAGWSGGMFRMPAQATKPFITPDSIEEYCCGSCCIHYACTPCRWFWEGLKSMANCVGGCCKKCGCSKGRCSECGKNLCECLKCVGECILK